MRTQTTALQLAAGAMVLSAITSVYGQSTPPATPAASTATAPTSAAAAPKAAAAKSSPASAGVLNDWLRKENAAFKAWDIGGQVRGRYEVFENAGPAFPNLDFQNGGKNDNSYFWTREKLHVGYNAPWFGAYTEGRNSNSMGDNDPKNPGEDSFDLHQAYVSVGNAKQFPVTAKVGRQELLYGDERLIGPSDWSNTGRVFDGAKLRFENSSLWVDAFAARVVVPVDGEFNESDHQDWLFGAYASSKTLVPVQESQLYFLSRNVGVGSAAGTAPRDIYSIGARVKSLPGKLKAWDYSLELVGQLGSVVQSGRRREQQAFATSVGGGYTFKKTWATPRVGLEYNFSTGDESATDGKSQTLDNLFPTNHRHYGYMDIVGWRNIHNPRLIAGIKPIKQLSVNLDYHLFWLANTHDSFYPQGGSGRNANGYGRNSQYDSFVGSEIDLDVNWTITPWAGLRAGYGHFFTGSYIESSKQATGATDADWLYAQATLNF